MEIRIDGATGEIEIGVFRLGKHTKASELRTIDPQHFEKRIADGENFFCDFAEIVAGDIRIACQSYHCDGSVLCYSFQPLFPGGNWDNFSEEKEARKLALLRKILDASGIADHQDFAWGHVVAGYSGRDGITSLAVAYYQRVR